MTRTCRYREDHSAFPLPSFLSFSASSHDTYIDHSPVLVPYEPWSAHVLSAARLSCLFLLLVVGARGFIACSPNAIMQSASSPDLSLPRSDMGIPTLRGLMLSQICVEGDPGCRKPKWQNLSTGRHELVNAQPTYPTPEFSPLTTWKLLCWHIACCCCSRCIAVPSLVLQSVLGPVWTQADDYFKLHRLRRVLIDDQRWTQHPEMSHARPSFAWK